MPKSASTFLYAACAMTAILSVTSVPAYTFDDPAPPRIDCSKKANKNNPLCKPQHGPLSEDEIYHAGYWLARDGKYREARQMLLSAGETSNARILNYIGFTTRKLGDVDRALPYYAKALTIDPDLTVARAYMGEAYLQKGDVNSAKAQLGEIEKRCGTSCAEYADLADQIARFESVAEKRG